MVHPLEGDETVILITSVDLTIITMTYSNTPKFKAVALARLFLITMLAGGMWVTAEEPRVPTSKEGKIDSGGKYTPPNKSENSSKPRKVLPRPQTEEALQKNLPVLRTGKHTFAVGKVIIDEVARTITIPATVNMVEGMVEYALVENSGKVHEALFATDSSAEHIHVAALLLGMKPQRETARKDGGIDVPEAGQIGIEVTWAKHGPAARFKLEDLVLLMESVSGTGAERASAKLAKGPWFYNGSKFQHGLFLAGGEGSLIALIPDPTALVNNPRPSRMRDDAHVPNQELLPVKGRPVKIIFQFPKLDSRKTVVEKPKP